MPARHHVAIVCIAAVLGATACGGSDDASRPDASPVKFYSGSFRQNQLVSLVSFDGGLAYGFYQEDFSQPQGPEFVYAGFFKASTDVSAGASIRTGRDYRFDTRETVPISLVDFSATDQALVTVIESNKGNESVFASRATVDELSTDAALLAGEYAAEARSTSDSQKGTASISSSGELQADLPGECHVTGSLSGRPKGNLYDAQVNFESSCTVASGSVTGHAFQSYLTRNIYVLLTSGSGNGVLLLFAPTAAP